jgi:Mn2+/Fe2+ NRAMP family transporter
VLTIYLLIAIAISLLGTDPLQVALLASTIIALFLPVSLTPFLFIMNDPDYLGNKTNGRLGNITLICILIIAFVVAIVSLPLEFLSGGG